MQNDLIDQTIIQSDELKTESPTTFIAIAGDGPAATAFLKQFDLFLQLVQQKGVPINPANIAFTVLGSNSVPGSGTPYSVHSTHQQHMGNQPPRNMACRDVRDPNDGNKDPNMDFCRWYAENYHMIDEWFPNLRASHPTLDFSPEAMLVKSFDGKIEDAKADHVERTYVLPRLIYGKYYEERFAEAIRSMQDNGITINLHSGSRVYDVNENTGNEMNIVYRNKNGEAYQTTANTLLMLTGHSLPPRFKGTLRPYMPVEEYNATVQENKKQHANVKSCVIGTSLSAIDAALTVLGNYGHWEQGANDKPVFVWDSNDRVHIDLCSRNGWLPKVRGQKSPRESIRFKDGMHHDCNTVEGLLELLEWELREAYGDNTIKLENYLNPVNADPARTLRKDIQKARHGDLVYNGKKYKGWESVLLSVDFSAVFNSLSDQEQNKFLRDYRSIFDVYSGPMPIYNAERILHLLNYDVISVRKLGKQPKFEIDEQSRKATVTDNENNSVTYHYAVDATGPNPDITQDEELYSRLVKNGTVTVHPVMKSVSIFHDTHSLRKVRDSSANDNHDTSNILASGVHAIGDNFWISGILDTVAESKKMALVVLQRVCLAQGLKLDLSIFDESEHYAAISAAKIDISRRGQRKGASNLNVPQSSRTASVGPVV